MFGQFQNVNDPNKRSRFEGIFGSTQNVKDRTQPVRHSVPDNNRLQTDQPMHHFILNQSGQHLVSANDKSWTNESSKHPELNMDRSWSNKSCQPSMPMNDRSWLNKSDLCSEPIKKRSWTNEFSEHSMPINDSSWTRESDHHRVLKTDRSWTDESAQQSVSVKDRSWTNEFGQQNVPINVRSWPNKSGISSEPINKTSLTNEFGKQSTCVPVIDRSWTEETGQHPVSIKDRPRPKQFGQHAIPIHDRSWLNTSGLNSVPVKDKSLPNEFGKYSMPVKDRSWTRESGEHSVPVNDVPMINESGQYTVPVDSSARMRSNLHSHSFTDNTTYGRQSLRDRQMLHEQTTAERKGDVNYGTESYKLTHSVDPQEAPEVSAYHMNARNVEDFNEVSSDGQHTSLRKDNTPFVIEYSHSSLGVDNFTKPECQSSSQSEIERQHSDRKEACYNFYNRESTLENNAHKIKRPQPNIHPPSGMSVKRPRLQHDPTDEINTSVDYADKGPFQQNYNLLNEDFSNSPHLYTAERTVGDQRAHDKGQVDQYRDQSSFYGLKSHQTMSQTVNPHVAFGSDNKIDRSQINKIERTQNTPTALEETEDRKQVNYEKLPSAKMTVNTSVNVSANKASVFSTPRRFSPSTFNRYHWQRNTSTNAPSSQQKGSAESLKQKTFHIINKKQVPVGDSGGKQQNTIPPAKAAVANKIQKFGIYLKTFQPGGDPASTFYRANSLHGSNFKILFNHNILYDKLPIMIGWLKIGGVCICHGFETNTKALKRSVFQKALKILKTKSINDIMSTEDVCFQAIKQEFNDELKSQNSIRAALTKVAGPIVADELYLPESSIVDEKESKNVNNEKLDGFAILQSYARKNFRIQIPSKVDISKLIKACGCSLKSSIKKQFFYQQKNPQLFWRHTYILHMIPIGVGKSTSRKESLRICLKTTIKNILDKTHEELKSGISFDDDSTLVNVPFWDVKHPLLEKLKKLIEFAKQSTFRPNRLILSINEVLSAMNMKPYIQFNPLPGSVKTIVCNFFISGRLIAFGCHTDRNTSLRYAYSNAWQALATSRASEWLHCAKGSRTQVIQCVEQEKSASTNAQFPSSSFEAADELNQQIEKNDLKILTTQQVEQEKSATATLQNVRNIEQGEDFINKKPCDSPSNKKFMLFEHSKRNGQRRKALKILKLSAQLSDMRLTFQHMMSLEADVVPGKKWLCKAKLDGEMISSAFGPSQVKAKSYAAKAAMKKFCTKVPLIEVVVKASVDRNIWHTYADIKSQQSVKGQNTKSTLQVCFELIDCITTEQPLRQVVFAPDLPTDEMCEIILYVKPKKKKVPTATLR